MKVTILRNTIADNGKDFSPGDTPDLPDSEALILLSVGAAKRIKNTEIETAESKHLKKETASRK